MFLESGGFPRATTNQLLVDDYGARGAGVAYSGDLAGILTAFAKSRSLRFRGGGNYNPSDTIDLTAAYGVNLLGAGPSASPGNAGGFEIGGTSGIEARYNNKPVLKVAGPVSIEKLYLGYSSQQDRATHPLSYCLELNNLPYGASIRDVRVWGGTVGVGIKQANFGGTGYNTVFGTTIENLTSVAQSECHIDLRPMTGGNTNNKFGNVYINGLAPLSLATDGVPCNYVMRCLNEGGLFQADTSIDGQVMLIRMYDLQNTRANFPLLRNEACKHKGNGAAWIEVGSGYNTLRIGAWEITNCKSLGADGVATQKLIYGNAYEYDIDVGHIFFDVNCQFTAAGFYMLDVAGDTSGKSRIRIHKITNRTNAAGGDGILMSFTTNNEHDIVEIFDGFRFFEDLRGNAFASGGSSPTSVKRRRNFVYETYCPGGANYSATKPWGLDGPTTAPIYIPVEVEVINPTGVGYPAAWFSPTGGIAPTDWYPSRYHGGENGKTYVGDANFSAIPYKGYQWITCYTATASRDLTLSAGTSPIAVKEGMTWYIKNSSGQNRVVKNEGGTTLFTLATGGYAEVRREDGVWQRLV